MAEAREARSMAWQQNRRFTHWLHTRDFWMEKPLCMICQIFHRRQAEKEMEVEPGWKIAAAAPVAQECLMEAAWVREAIPEAPLP